MGLVNCMCVCVLLHVYTFYAHVNVTCVKMCIQWQSIVRR